MALTAKQRNALPSGAFVGPDRSYPVDTANRARNALSRAAQNAGPELKAKIKAKVHRRFPSIKVSGEGEPSKVRADRPSRRTD